ncbi:MAG: Gfo/Idh/MocA family protein [Pirellulales bacterium]
MSRLRVAVVGAGHLGRIHARLLAEIPAVELVGVVDPVPAARERVAADCHTTPYADHHELLARVDAATIVTPTRYHHGVALDFLRAGKPLLIEKPLAADLAEADELVLTAQRHGALLQVGHIERFNPAFAAAAAHVVRPRYIEAVRASTYTGRSTDIGVVYDLMIHDIDLVLSLVDSPLVEAQAIGLALLGRHEDVAQARLQFANGAVANLSASRVSYTTAPRRQMNIWHEHGYAGIDFGTRCAHHVTPCEAVQERTFDYNGLSAEEKATFKDRLHTEILRVEPLDVETRNALADELADFAASVREQREPRVTGAQGRQAVAVAEAILQSIRTHQWEGSAAGPVGPLATPGPAILRGPHWHAAAPSPHPSQPQPSQPQRREAG